MFILSFVTLAFVLPEGRGKVVVEGEFVGRDELGLREEFEGC